MIKKTKLYKNIQLEMVVKAGNFLYNYLTKQIMWGV